MKKKFISIISPTYNELDNIEELYKRVCAIMDQFAQYDFEYVIIDNASTDGTDQKLLELASKDNRLKVIINTRNFGHIRSPYWGIIQTSGDATVYLASDLQDPPELIAEFITQWESGEKVVLAVKPVSETNRIVHFLRKSYYAILNKVSEVEIIRDSTGFGLYDKTVIDEIRKIGDPYPFLRGLICEIGYPIKTLDFNQPARVRGLSKNNFNTLYDIAMLGIISHSVMPIRVVSFIGFIVGLISLVLGLFIVAAKILYWDAILITGGPLYVLLLGLFGLMFIFLGLIGEYVGSILTYVQNRPVVVEKERVNF